MLVVKVTAAVAEIMEVAVAVEILEPAPVVAVAVVDTPDFLLVQFLKQMQ